MPDLRTPDERFADLPGFPFAAHYIEDLAAAGGARIHYVDEGPASAGTVWLCLHGEPTWSYLYRKMIPVFVDAGHRVVAPDLPGFGRSDKPDDDALYTFDFHRDVLREFIERLDLTGIRLVCQDWGGLLGLTLPMSMPDRFAGLLVMNTMLGTGDVPLSEGFLGWRDFVASQPDLQVSALMKRAVPGLGDTEAAAYDAPFPDITYKAGVRRFPQMVPEHRDDPGAELSRQARQWWQSEWRGRSLMAIGMQDPVLGPPVMQQLHACIKGCPPPVEVADAGHFVQERGEEIATRAVVELTA